MGQGHSHVPPQGGNERALKIALALTSTFLIAEAVAGVLTQSLALISDAAHMLTDSAALAIALFAIRIGKPPWMRLQLLRTSASSIVHWQNRLEKLLSIGRQVHCG